jgi:hypothetical protein
LVNFGASPGWCAATTRALARCPSRIASSSRISSKNFGSGLTQRFLEGPDLVDRAHGRFSMAVRIPLQRFVRIRLR